VPVQVTVALYPTSNLFMPGHCIRLDVNSLGEENRFLEVTYANGDKEVLYFKDYSSGAMIESVVLP